MKIHNLYELTVSKEILSSIDRVDQFGDKMWSPADIQWANEVVHWFKRLYYRAKKMIGSWAARVKLVWMQIKHRIYMERISPCIYKVAISNTYDIVFKNGIVLSFGLDNPIDNIKVSSLRSLFNLIKIIE